jgi:hypothetical protein
MHICSSWLLCKLPISYFGFCFFIALRMCYIYIVIELGNTTETCAHILQLEE